VTRRKQHCAKVIVSPCRPWESSGKVLSAPKLRRSDFRTHRFRSKTPCYTSTYDHLCTMFESAGATNSTTGLSRLGAAFTLSRFHLYFVYSLTVRSYTDTRGEIDFWPFGKSGVGILHLFVLLKGDCFGPSFLVIQPSFLVIQRELFSCFFLFLLSEVSPCQCFVSAANGAALR
jgi:hypothetical protein